jgi:microcin C transport system substrate-binding protein
MKPVRIKALLLCSPFIASSAFAAPSHCLSLYDACKYTLDFKHFEYVNPNAPKGGQVKLAETGSFDNLNPFILKGVKAPGIGELFQSLMVPSMDEPQSLYGLVAETVDVSADNSKVDFTLRKEARWHDGTAITPDDVVFTFNTLKEKGDPSYKILFAPVSKCEKIGERGVRFTFSDTKNRELPTIVAQMPLISKAYYATREFDKTTLEAPLGSGAYMVESVEQGRNIIYKRVENHWAKDLAVSRGLYNFGSIRYDMYRDENVTLEALKAGEYDFRREYIARNWATAYNAPAVKDGRIIKREIPDFTPQGMQAFIFNARKEKLSDVRVRQAIDLSMDYEWLNKTIFYGAYVRNASFFENTDFQTNGIPGGKELELLKPFSCHSREGGNPSDLKMDPRVKPEDDNGCLPPALFTQPYTNATTDGSGNNRDNLLRAQKLLEYAGYVIKDGKRVDKKGEQLSVEFLLRQPTMERVIGPMRKNLERLGIASAIRIVDDSQYQKRVDEHDFDIVSVWVNRGVFYPGNEQTALWHSSQAAVKGSSNLGGTKNKAIDAMLDALTKAKNKEDLVAAGRALDRILLWQHVVIPNWHSSVFRVAYWNKLGMPEITPKYNLGFQTWWVKQ